MLVVAAIEEEEEGADSAKVLVLPEGLVAERLMPLLLQMLLWTQQLH